MKRFDHLLGTILVCFLSALALTACGGGGSGGGPTGPSYSGAITPAEITAVDASTLVFDAYNGGELGSSLSAATFSVASQGPAGQPLVLGSILQKTALQLDWQPGARSMEVIPLTTGPCGGSFSGEVLQNADGTSVSGQITYAGYCSEGVVLDGTLLISGSLAGNGDVSIAMATSGLTTTSSGEAFTVAGSVSMGFNINQPNPPVTLSMDMLLSDAASGKDYWVNNFQMTTTPGGSGASVTISGRYYDFDRGYLDVTTTAPLQVDSFGTPLAGSLHFAGGNGTYADLNATGGGSYELVVFDGVFTTITGTFQ